MRRPGKRVFAATGQVCDLGRVVGVVVHDEDAVDLADALEAAADAACRRASAAGDFVDASRPRRRAHGDGAEGVLDVVTAGKAGSRSRRTRSPLRRAVKLWRPVAGVDVGGAPVGVRCEAVGEDVDAGLGVVAQGEGFVVVGAEEQRAAGHDVRREAAERLLHRLPGAVVVEVVGLDVGDERRRPGGS